MQPREVAKHPWLIEKPLFAVEVAPEERMIFPPVITRPPPEARPRVELIPPPKVEVAVDVALNADAFTTSATARPPANVEVAASPLMVVVPAEPTYMVDVAAKIEEVAEPLMVTPERLVARVKVFVPVQICPERLSRATFAERAASAIVPAD